MSPKGSRGCDLRWKHSLPVEIGDAASGQRHQIVGNDDPANEMRPHRLQPGFVRDHRPAWHEVREHQRADAGLGGDAAHLVRRGMAGEQVFAQDGELAHKVAHRLHVTGAVLSPFSAWLTLRGCRSLGARMAMHCANARKVAEFLAAHPAIERVNWPGLASHPGHDVAARQMQDFGAMLSIEVRGGREAALAMTGKLRVFTNATSLGGCESLIEHRASVEGPNPRSPQNLLRISIGLEHADDLIADLAQALDGAG